MFLPCRILRDGRAVPPAERLHPGKRLWGLLRALPLLLASWLALPAGAATLANHMDAVESASLWCQDERQQWAEHRVAGPLDPEQQTAFSLPTGPCFFLEVGQKDSLLNFSITQELGAEDLLDLNYSPYGDVSLDVSRKGEPLFSAEGDEKDRGLARDPDRHPPDPVEAGPLLDALVMDLPKEKCLVMGLPYRTADESLELRTALSSEGVIWRGNLYLYEDRLSVASLTTPLDEATLEKLFAALAAKGYRHAEENEESISFTDDPLLGGDAASRREALRGLLAELAAPEAEPYEVMFLPDLPQGERARAETIQVQVRIAPGTGRIEVTLSTYEAADE